MLEIERRESALLRIVSTCHRRRCRIVALTYELGPQMQAATLTLDVMRPPQGARTLVAWLSALVDVRAAHLEHGLGAHADGHEVRETVRG